MTNAEPRIITMTIPADKRERWRADELYKRRTIAACAARAQRLSPGRRITLQVIGIGIGIEFYELHGGKAVLREE